MSSHRGDCLQRHNAMQSIYWEPIFNGLHCVISHNIVFVIRLSFSELKLLFYIFQIFPQNKRAKLSKWIPNCLLLSKTRNDATMENKFFSHRCENLNPNNDLLIKVTSVPGTIALRNTFWAEITIIHVRHLLSLLKNFLKYYLNIFYMALKDICTQVVGVCRASWQEFRAKTSPPIYTFMSPLLPSNNAARPM